MANRRVVVFIGAGAAIVVAGLVIGGVALGTSGVFAPDDDAEVGVVVDEPASEPPSSDAPPSDAPPSDAPPSEQPPTQAPLSDEPQWEEPVPDVGPEICWVFSGGGWLGAPCPPAEDE